MLTVGVAERCAPELNSIGRNYVEAVRRGGHVAFVLPFTLDREMIVAMLDRVDVLLLCGGGDIAAYRFGQDQSPLSSTPNEERDSFELLLMKVALEMKKPVVGTCRGLQLINVALGGTLIQDITDKQEVIHQREDKLWEPVHEVIIEEDSRLFAIIGETRTMVNSTHHQVIQDLGRTLRVVARSTDGFIEAIESDIYPVAAVQWHPERLFSQDILWKQIKNWASK